MEVYHTTSNSFQPSISQLSWNFLLAYIFAGFFFPVSFKHCTYLSYLFACWYYLSIISIPIIVSSAYLYFHILLCLIIPWLQWLPLLWSMYTCSEWFPKQESQKHSGLFCLARLMLQKYSGLFFTTSSMFKLNKNKATKQSHKRTGYAPSKICWLNFWAPSLGPVGLDILNPVLLSSRSHCQEDPHCPLKSLLTVSNLWEFWFCFHAPHLFPRPQAEDSVIKIETWINWGHSCSCPTGIPA